ncbi:hypothetical protein J6590_025016 [Homalodisca vitripennis]|nr:hypothetical protein J6590_025016 [Homalodisca vitripennis]
MSETLGTREPVEIKIPVPWGHISGKWWGPQDKNPVIAIHGWQDNAGTFDNLAPLLPADVPFLCIDLPGHGFSSHLPPTSLNECESHACCKRAMHEKHETLVGNSRPPTEQPVTVTDW